MPVPHGIGHAARSMIQEKRIRELKAELAVKRDEIRSLLKWVNDLQAGMYINCVYCGHRYGPDDEVEATMQQALYDHIKVCPEHPLSKALSELGEAAREINCAGPVAHRIRVMKREWSEHARRLEASERKLRARHGRRGEILTRFIEIHDRDLKNDPGCIATDQWRDAVCDQARAALAPTQPEPAGGEAVAVIQAVPKGKLPVRPCPQCDEPMVLECVSCSYRPGSTEPPECEHVWVPNTNTGGRDCVVCLFHEPHAEPAPEPPAATAECTHCGGTGSTWDCDPKFGYACHLCKGTGRAAMAESHDA